MLNVRLLRYKRVAWRPLSLKVLMQSYVLEICSGVNDFLLEQEERIISDHRGQLS